MKDPRIETARLLLEATEWRLLALLFSCPDASWRDQIAELAASLSDPQLQQAAARAREEASPEMYHTVFGPGGPAAPREVSYQQATLSGRFLAELRDFYCAFAYDSQTGELPDHVATEADFYGYLRMKEAYAHSRGDEEQATVTARAAGRFLADHLALIAQPLARALEASDVQYLALAAAALLRRVGPAPESAFPAGSGAEAPAPLELCDLQPECSCREDVSLDRSDE